ncbi:MAG: tetratricopeptide repeat protein [Candidatus Aminicenantes bacterium]|nr:tetratricopeptide repeat protein [Candidatus Aminicenantes bacterium]
MTRKRRLIAAGALLLALAAAWILIPRGAGFDRLKSRDDYNVILITVDTLRADRIGCYGFQGVETPTMDMFASRGVKFDRCYAPTPLTLPSHTTLMTGTHPAHHAVRDNGGFVVPSELATLAELYKAKGYATAAFVAAYVLDSKWGLDRGFDHYFDRFDLSRFERISLGSVQRPANEVIDESLAWLAANKDRPFFAWIHLYDPHTPYEPPPEYAARYPNNPYLGEIAFTDSQLKRLWDALSGWGLADDLFLVFAADHGESLGEHNESTHGFFVYQAAIHVPLIFVTPFPGLQGVSTAQVCGLVDVLPTLCEMSGLPVPAQNQGSSLVRSFFKPERTARELAYAESFYPRFHYGWSELKSVQDDRWKLILAPAPELYDLTRDPREQTNLAAVEKKVFADLSAEAERFLAQIERNALEIDFRKIDEDTREKLASLGYIGSFTDSAKLKGRKLADPKDKIGVFNELSRARELGMSGDPEEGARIIRAIIRDDPDIADAHFALGNIYFKQRKFLEAVAAFKRSLEIKPDDSFTVINIANSYVGLRRLEEAEAFVLDYLKKGFSDSQLFYLLGNMSYHRKEYDKAVMYFEECLAQNPDSAASHNALTALYITRGDLVRAEEHNRSAMAINPKLSNVHYNRAQILEARGDLAAAAESYRTEIASTPSHFKALFNLARVYRKLGRPEQERACLESAVEADADFPLTYFYLARIRLNSGEDYGQAVALVKKGIELEPEKHDLALGYFLLADLYNRLGEASLSRDYALRGQTLAAETAGRR